eukprot:2702193-Pyramimonas_sp.AAC.1
MRAWVSKDVDPEVPPRDEPSLHKVNELIGGLPEAVDHNGGEDLVGGVLQPKRSRGARVPRNGALGAPLLSTLRNKRPSNVVELRGKPLPR